MSKNVRMIAKAYSCKETAILPKIAQNCIRNEIPTNIQQNIELAILYTIMLQCLSLRRRQHLYRLTVSY